MAYELIVIGASWGGFQAVGTLLGQFDGELGAAVAVAQHRAPDWGSTRLVERLGESSALPVREVDDKDDLAAGRVYLAPADYHLLVEPGALSLSVDDPVRHSRPSIDVLFESAADAYGAAIVAVVLTGANDDGAAGVRAVRAAGGTIVVQDPSEAERREMPAAALATGAADHVVRLAEVARLLNELCHPADGGPR